MTGPAGEDHPYGATMPLDRRGVDPTSLPYRDTTPTARNRELIEAGEPLRVYVDDLRTPARHEEQWVIVRTAFEAVELLSAHEVAELSLDHDFGVAQLRDQGVAKDVLELVGEGYDVIRWLEARLLGEDDDRVPAEINVHSANAVGVGRMIAGIRSMARRISLVQVDGDGRTWRRTDR